MLLADADPFWKPPTVYDAVGVVSFVAGLASIWLSWWLARRDLEERINRAERHTAAAVHLFILQAAVADVRRHVELANEALLAANWPRARLHSEEAAQGLTRLLFNAALRTSDRNTLRLTLDRIKVLGEAFNAHPQRGRGRLTAPQHNLIETVLAELRAIEGLLQTTTGNES